MRNKLFTSILFHNKKLIIIYFVLLFISIFLILRQIGITQMKTGTIEIPDIEIQGKIEKREGGLYETYSGLDDITKQFVKGNQGKVMLYEIWAENIFTFSSPFYHVSYYLYGIDETLFEIFRGKAAEGEVPQTGKKEVLAGSNIAAHYQLSVGDVLDSDILENIEDFQLGGEEYVISGILSDEDSHYSNGFFTARENLGQPLDNSKSNMVYIYISGKGIYKNLIKQVEELQKNNMIGNYNDNYKIKEKEKKKAAESIILTASVSFFVLGSLFMYVLKGMIRNVGILKALGIPDTYAYSTFCIGFGIFMTAVCLMDLAAAVFMLDISLSAAVKCIILVGGGMYAAANLGFIIAFRKILPEY